MKAIPVLLAALLAAPSSLHAADSSLILKIPPGWNGFEMEASVTAGYRASGDPSDVLSNTEVQTATVSPTAGLSALDEVSVPRASASMVPPSGDPADKVSAGLDVDYRVGSPTGRDTFHIDFEVNASALDAGADFGSGDVKVDAFAEVTVTLRSTAPLRAADFPGAVFSVPDLPALADPANEGMFATFRVPHRDRTSEPTSPYEPPLVGFVLPGNPGPDVFLDMRPASPLHLDETLEYTFTFEVVVPYGSASTTGYTLLGAAGLDRALVTTTNDSGPGSLRQALAVVPEGGVVAFDPSLAGQTIHLTTGQLEVDAREFIIEARDLAEKVTIDAGGLSRVLQVRDSKLDLNGVGITGGTTPFNGGGIYCIASNISLTDSCLLGNQADDGAAIAQTGASKLHLQRVLVVDNAASGAGGGLFLDGGWLQLGAVVIDSEFQGNSATWGGALALTPALDGVEPSFDLDVRNSTFHGNTAVQRGGASFQAKGVFEQCTFFNNSAGTKGGALLTRWPTEIRHCTITGNTAPLLFGSGVHAEDGTTTVFSSIIAGNGPSDLDIESGSFTSAGFNAVGFGLGTLPFGTATDDIKGIADPLLAPLGDYGGPTPTMLPQSNSPAVDAGSTDLNSPDVDQRGLPRRADGDGDGASFVDAGAAESEQALLVVTNGNDSGPGSLRQAITDIPDSGRIVFLPVISFVFLSGGELLVESKTITIDGSVLRSRVFVGGLPAFPSRVLQIGTGADVTLRGLEISNGTALEGGGIRNTSFLRIEDCSIHGCRGDTGAGLFNDSTGTVLISDSTIFENSASTVGGGLVNRGLMVVTDSNISGNCAELAGGIWMDGATQDTTLTRCAISCNTAQKSGGLRLQGGILTATQCTIAGNTCRKNGGGLHAVASTAIVEHCTLWGNFAHGTGGAISAERSSVTLRHCTLTGNGAPTGSGIRLGAGAPLEPTILTVFSSILAGNSGEDLLHEGGDIISEGHNVIGLGSGTGFFSAAGDTTGIADPLLTPPGEYGGGLLTLLPLPGSPALESGGDDGSLPASDQRGQPRLQDGDGNGTASVDAGATEGLPPATTLFVTNSAESGLGSLRQALLEADPSLPGTRIAFAAGVDGKTLVLTSGPLAISGKHLFLDAGDLTSGFTIDGGGATTVLSVESDSSAVLRNITIQDGGYSSPDSDGGGITAEGSLSLDRCVVSGNHTDALGGGILLTAPGGNLILRDTEVSNNESTSGGTGAGGGILIEESSAAILVDSILTGNNGSGDGGGLVVRNGSTLLRGCEISGNQSSLGGGMRLNGPGALSQCSIVANTATTFGGGVLTFGPCLNALDSTFASNSAPDGGALYVSVLYEGSPCWIDQCTFYLNSATDYGGAILSSMGDLTVRFSTLTNNQAGLGGGGIASSNSPATILIDSTIVSGNQPDDVATAPGVPDQFVSDGWNLIGTTNGTTAFTAPGDQPGVLDPMLSPPGDYGGPTWTMIPLSGSPARDGSAYDASDMPRYDQRGFPRDVGPAPDIGAYEVSGHGGFPVWALESIPTGEDMSFGGNADNDRNANGLEYGVGTDGDVSDPGAPENVRVRTTQFDSQLAFGFRPEATDVTWRVMRSTDLQNWSEIYRFDGETEFLIPDVTALFDFDERTITVKDRNPPQPEAYYRLEVDYTP